MTIEQPPPYLAAMLEALSSPITATDVLAQLRQSCPQADPEEAAAVFEDLLTLGIIQPEASEGRYHRHQLYFDLLGVDSDVYEQTLETKRVGIIGCGGIGSTCALLLAASGLGQIVLSDADLIEESNLTRTLLFEEKDIGMSKVAVASRRLADRNHNVSIVPVCRAFGPGVIEEHFATCDVLILSADSPADVHRWTNEASLKLGIPYINVGYAEVFGSVGPFVIPHVSACYECTKLGGGTEKELNHRLQAASYGPLNGLVSCIAVNEVLRYLMGLPIRSLGARMQVDSTSYEAVWYDFIPNPACRCRPQEASDIQDTTSSVGEQEVRNSNDKDRFDELAEAYQIYREENSFNALLLDDLIIKMTTEGEASCLRVLDVGCGIGTLSTAIAARGHQVTAVDISRRMLDIFRTRIPNALAPQITLLEGDVATYPLEGTYDRILLNLILDHIADPCPLLSACQNLMTPRGKMIVVVPHPFKDAGVWSKRMIAGSWHYQHLQVDNYFEEGIVEKAREDDAGNTVISSITSHRRTLSTYFSMLRKNGFQVDELLEPQPESTREDDDSVNRSKSARIPYFLVLSCSRTAS